jgi:hypothetical protein
MEPGAYVLATKYSDGDPADNEVGPTWCVGFYIGETQYGRHLVGDKDGGPHPHGYRYSGFREVGVIDEELGKWLVDNSKILESAPVGTINLWDLVRKRNVYLESTKPDHQEEPT